MHVPFAIRRPHVLALLSAVLCCALALPATALAGGGGGGAGLSGSGGSSGSSSSGSGSSSGPAPTAQPGNVTVSVTGDGITMQARSSTMLSRRLTFSGTAPAGDTIEIERLGHQTNWQWAPTVRATAGSSGAFNAVWDTNHIGRFAIRAVLTPPGSSPAQASSLTPSMTITVYRPSIATLYGPGFYGQRTACGQRLTRTTIGVANRTLPCGSKVALYWHGRTFVVPVVDRGPYANHADWDLTTATARALGMTGTETIGAVSLPRP